MSDLETRVRDALRADEIGWDDLRQPTPRVGPRSPRRWPTVLATAAAVAVVATVASVLALTGDGTNGPAGAHPAYAGYVWKLNTLTYRSGPIVGAASFGAQIAFSDTAVVGTFMGASIFGHYQVTSDGYHLTDFNVSGPATSIGGRNAARIGSAFARVFVNSTNHVSRRSKDLATVTARASGDQLVLQANGVTMRLSRVGPSHLSPIIDAVGFMWNVRTLTDAHGQLTIPDRLHAGLGFDWLGLLLAKDTVNTMEGRFDLSSDGYVVRHLFGSSLVGYAGQDRTTLRLKAAVDAVAAGGAAVTATLDGDVLTLHRGAVTITLARGAAMPNELTFSESGSGGGGHAQVATSAAASSAVAPAPHSATAPPSPVRRGHGAPGSRH